MICPACLSQCQIQESPAGAHGSVVRCDSCAATWSLYARTPQPAGRRVFVSARYIEKGSQMEDSKKPRAQDMLPEKVLSIQTSAIMALDSSVAGDEHEKAGGFWDALQYETSLLLYGQPPTRQKMISLDMAPEDIQETPCAHTRVLSGDVEQDKKKSTTAPALQTTYVARPPVPRGRAQKNGLRVRLVKAYRILFLNMPDLETDRLLLLTDPVVEGLRRRARWRARNTLTPMRLLGWSLWASSVFAVAYLLIFERESVVRLWPESRALFTAIGGEQQKPSLVLQGILHRYAMSDQGPVIEIRGTLSNDTNQDVSAPFIQVIAYGEGNRQLAEWEIGLHTPRLRSGMAMPFISRAEAPLGVKRIILYPAHQDIPHASLRNGQDIHPLIRSAGY